MRHPTPPTPSLSDRVAGRRSRRAEPSPAKPSPVAARWSAALALGATIGLASAAVVGGGCDREEARTYDAPKVPAGVTGVSAADPHLAKVPPHDGQDPPAGHPPIGGDASTTSDPAASPAAAAAGPTPPGPTPAGPSPIGPSPIGPSPAGPTAAAPASGGDKETAVTIGAIQATVPAGWKADVPRPMREATYLVGDPAKNTTVQIVRLGSAGDFLGNVNRWRGQVKLPPVAQVNEADIPKVKVGGGDAMLLDLAGPADAPTLRQVLAIVPRPDGSTFYIKLIGDAAVVAQNKADFDKFLASIQFAG